MNLVVMAAGMGSRFGGMKQIEPVGPSGDFIIDYSIFDAIKAGFEKVIFIIKEENYDIFRDTVGKRVEKYIDVDYAFQRIEDIPDGFTRPADREKPWGTSHAILAAKDLIHENFAIINADDFYGRDAFVQAANFFKEGHSDEYAIIGYKTENTLTENGAVKRGVCEIDDGYLTKIIESSIEKKDGVIVASPLDGSSSFIIDKDTLVSMNMFCFHDDMFAYLDEHLVDFFEENKDDLSKCEYLLPDLVEKSIKSGRNKVKMIPTTSVWYGMTYKEDLEGVKKSIQKMIDDGVYSSNLWELNNSEK